MKNYFQFLLVLMISVMAFGQVKANEPVQQVPGRIKQVTDDFYVNLDYYDQNPKYERMVDRSNHLHGWSKFCKIYGIISAGVGGFCLGAGISAGDGYSITVGSLAAVEGIVVAGIGGSLSKMCKKEREEIMRINSVGFPTSEIKINDKTLSPCLNLITDSRTRETTLGLGLSLTF